MNRLQGVSGAAHCHNPNPLCNKIVPSTYTKDAFSISGSKELSRKRDKTDMQSTCTLAINVFCISSI